MTAAAKLRELVKASDAAWKAACKSGLGLDCPVWQAAADAECAHREANGWDYASTGKRNYMPRVA